MSGVADATSLRADGSAVVRRRPGVVVSGTLQGLVGGVVVGLVTPVGFSVLFVLDDIDFWSVLAIGLVIADPTRS